MLDSPNVLDNFKIFDNIEILSVFNILGNPKIFEGLNIGDQFFYNRLAYILNLKLLK